MAAILDERSSSDGDIFPYMFREAGLGPLIGRRSWGGVVGISGRGPLIDDAALLAALDRGRLIVFAAPGEAPGKADRAAD